ncbi:MAG: hypothetical protein IPK17_00205 [Chloroflexi bacterium]|uniref:hypothetical protein n=1 Tax=Candidatus Flexifilum breve TaxID=3140694 RepID=UPI00313765F9|nr:hypothetical protein [Chloroflexota bacterium]
MGTDEPPGRDVFSRVLHGRNGVFVALCISTVSTTIGLFAGALSAFGVALVDRIMV